MKFKKYKVEYFFDSEDLEGNQKIEELGSKEIFDYQKCSKMALAYLQASLFQMKANRLRFTLI